MNRYIILSSLSGCMVHLLKQETVIGNSVMKLCKISVDAFLALIIKE